MENSFDTDSTSLNKPTTSLAMKTPLLVSIIFLLAIFVSISWAHDDHSSSSSTSDAVLRCLYSKSPLAFPKIVHTPQNSSYLSVLQFAARNTRFLAASTPTPQIIVTPFRESQIKSVIECTKKHGLQIRIRSGGHDYEGLSSATPVPFLILDLENFRDITLDLEGRSAWVEAGAQLGELYYAIAQQSTTLGFVAGFCPTVGVGGHFGGGGVGFISRKFGMAADNVIDAKIMDVNGRILDRKSMGEDLFWALKGAGSAGFGVLLAFKIKLVDLPPKVTVFNVVRTSEQNVSETMYRWQYVASKIDVNFFSAMFVRSTTSPETGKRTTFANFPALYLGGVDDLLPLLSKELPELGIKREECIEMTWVESTIYMYFGTHKLPLEVLLNRSLPISEEAYKGKPDFVEEPLPRHVIQGIEDWLHKEDEFMGFIRFMPFGGIHDEMTESETPYPHRKGIMYGLDEMIYWVEKSDENSEKNKRSIRSLHNYLEPYVTKNPRRAYFNFKDLDLGINNLEGETSYEQAISWGYRYFKDNFRRLAHIKAKVDPTDYFKFEQSVPPLFHETSNVM